MCPIEKDFRPWDTIRMDKKASVAPRDTSDSLPLLLLLLLFSRLRVKGIENGSVHMYNIQVLCVCLRQRS